MKMKEALRNNDDYPIDVVLTWVDGSDAKWREVKAAYSAAGVKPDSGASTDGICMTNPDNGVKPDAICMTNSDNGAPSDAICMANPDNGASSDAISNSDSGAPTDRTSSDDTDERYRDWETLKYLFRGIETCMPWVRTVHFVTCGQTPDWLNQSHPKLHLVNHTDYIPHKYLPTFNSHTIELNFHRIDGLSEHFIYLNDDVFPMLLLDRHDFFVGGYPVDMLALQPVVANPSNEVMSHIYLNNTLAIARHFNKYETMHKLKNDYFNIRYPLKNYVYNHLEKAFPLYSGFYTVHGASPLCKSTYEEVWDKEYELLDATCSHRFRDTGDVSQYLLREWAKQSGQFVAANTDKLLSYYNISDDCAPVVDAIRHSRKKMICINDANTPIHFEKLKQDLISAFSLHFPDKSGFEIQ